MPLVDPRKLFAKLDALGVDEVRQRLASGAFGSWRRPTVEEWLRRAERLPAPDTYMYHPVDAPTGKLFHSSQVEALRIGGWYDTPTNFPKSRWAPLVRSAKAWWSEWEWLVKAVSVVVGLIASVVGLIKLFR